MIPARRKLLAGGAIIVLGLAFAAYQGARSSLVYYLTTSEFAARTELRAARVRIAGRVAEGSVVRFGGESRFVIADEAARLEVRYRGPLPDLFAEGKDVLVEGRLASDGVLQASQVISTHPVEYKEKRPRR